MYEQKWVRDAFNGLIISQVHTQEDSREESLQVLSQPLKHFLLSFPRIPFSNPDTFEKGLLHSTQ
jgi:hypothetical protein